jgi:DNA-binding CsgD family transcriptional regulator
VAATLSLSPKTASTYRARVLEKMRLTSNADLVRYAAQRGLIR